MELEEQGFCVKLVNVVDSGIYKFILKLMDYGVEVKAGEVFLWQSTSSFLNHILRAVNNLPAVR